MKELLFKDKHQTFNVQLENIDRLYIEIDGNFNYMPFTCIDNNLFFELEKDDRIIRIIYKTFLAWVGSKVKFYVHEKNTSPSDFELRRVMSIPRRHANTISNNLSDSELNELINFIVELDLVSKIGVLCTLVKYKGTTLYQELSNSLINMQLVKEILDEIKCFKKLNSNFSLNLNYENLCGEV